MIKIWPHTRLCSRALRQSFFESVEKILTPESINTSSHFLSPALGPSNPKYFSILSIFTPLEVSGQPRTTNFHLTGFLLHPCASHREFYFQAVFQMTQLPTLPHFQESDPLNRLFNWYIYIPSLTFGLVILDFPLKMSDKIIFSFMTLALSPDRIQPRWTPRNRHTPGVGVCAFEVAWSVVLLSTRKTVHSFVPVIFPSAAYVHTRVHCIVLRV